MKLFYIILGSVSLVLGVVGIFLPLLPTTPFLLLAAALYLKGSPKLYGWLLAHRYLGSYIRNYREKKAITLPAKITSLALLWVTILFSILFVVDPLWLKILLGMILGGVTSHIVSFKTLRKEDIIKYLRAKDADIPALSTMSMEAGREVYSQVMPVADAEKLIALRCSSEAIASNMKAGQDYYIINAGGENAGYFSVASDGDRLGINNLYILPGERRKGYARDSVEYISNLCRRNGFSEVSLNLPHFNGSTLQAVIGLGFSESTPLSTEKDGIPFTEIIYKKAV